MRVSPILLTSLLIVLIIAGFSAYRYELQVDQLGSSRVTPQAYTISQPSSSPIQTILDPVPHLSLDQIFSTDHTWIKELDQSKIRTLVVTGDVLTARYVNYKAVAANNFTRLFEQTVDVLKPADIALINLETPLIPKCPLTNKGMVFCGDLRHLEGLSFAGIDVVSIGNNHGGNHGIAGVEATVKALQDANMAPIGTLNGGVAYKEVDGQIFAFLAYNDVDKQPGIAFADKVRIEREITEAKTKADLVVIMFHWGAEYRSQPTDRQIELGRQAIDLGADLVVSNHPHWIQPIEIYKGKVIAYALGNFIFDQTWSKKTQEGVVARFTYFDKTLIDLEFLPVSIAAWGQPTFMTGTEKERIMNEMMAESLKFKRAN